MKIRNTKFFLQGVPLCGHFEIYPYNLTHKIDSIYLTITHMTCDTIYDSKPT